MRGYYYPVCWNLLSASKILYEIGCSPLFVLLLYDLRTFLKFFQCPSKIEEATHGECEGCFDSTYMAYNPDTLSFQCKCISPFFINTEGTKCVQLFCPPGQYVDSNSQCSAVGF